MGIFENSSDLQPQGFLVVVLSFGEPFEHDPGYTVVAGAGPLMYNYQPDVCQNDEHLFLSLILDQCAVIIPSLDLLVLHRSIVIVGDPNVSVDCSEKFGVCEFSNL